MSQSEWLGLWLLTGFIVWLAMNQRLGVYWSVLTGGAAAAAIPSGTPVPNQPGANMPMPRTAPSAPAPAPSAPTLPFSLKNTPFCILGGTLCN